MAKCEKCNAEIPDGQQYCSECMEKENKESYLDSLLNSVDQDKMDEQINRFAKRKSKAPVPQPEEIVLKDEENVAESDISEAVITDNLIPDEQQEPVIADEPVATEEEPTVSEPVVSEETEGLAFEHMLSEDIRDFEDMSLADADKYDIMKLKDHSDTEFDRMFQAEMEAVSSGAKDLQAEENLREAADAGAEPLNTNPAASEEPEESLYDSEKAEQEVPLYNSEETEPEVPLHDSEEVEPEVPLYNSEDAEPEELAVTEEDLLQEEPSEELLETVAMLQEELPEQDFVIPDIAEMADSLTESEEEYAEPAAMPEADSEMDNDILDLINSMNSPENEEGQEASGADTDLFALEDIPAGDDMAEADGQPGDIEGVFSDTLRSVDMLSDEEQRVLMDIPMLDEEAKDDGKKKKKEKKERKPGIFKRIFGNIPSNRSEEEIAKMKEKIIADAEAKERAAEEKKQKAAAEKEAKEKKAAEDKAAAAVKKQEQAKIKAEKKAEAARIKKDAKERKKQELQELIDEIDHDEGKINRIGASIIFVIFAAMAVGVLLGTRIYAYTVNMQNAQDNFEMQRYEDAYQNVYGMDIKDEDEDFYLQVMTVMYTYKQLNSYQNYYAMGEYPQALDSLIKGLQRYDKYVALASVIGIEDDMDFVRDEILEQLSQKFQIEEREALVLSAMADKEEYANTIYQIAAKTVADSK